MPPKDYTSRKQEEADLTKLLHAVSAKLDCLSTMESKLEAIDAQQLQNTAIQRLEIQYRQSKPYLEGRASGGHQDRYGEDGRFRGDPYDAGV
ncbi:hypothetical protein PR202_ga07470 [Eleusine coracana subsp. coracana]|uniref:Uncharacterized protein n=1 Tax=Eleusine coracana subsp. coracana TaxID=191504 RepID=A0AAV5BXK2_ELECO|nr:hypothetical protein PR202_ga07470 [Eleusine coracana subsp. coracana]